MSIDKKLLYKINEVDLLKNHKKKLEKVFQEDQPKTSGYAPGLIINTEDFVYGEYFIPQGFIFDGASIPGFAQGKFFPWSVGGAFRPEYIKAAIVHDYLYRTQITSRKKADKILRKLLLENGVNRYEAGKMYLAVRIGGGIPWRKNAKTILVAKNLL